MTSLIGTPYLTVLTADDSRITFDCVVNENHNDTLTITEHPVEEGANVADHAQKEPDEVTLSGIISNQPILLQGVDTLQPSVPGGTPENRAQDAYNEFRRLQESAKLLTLETEIRDYENMLIKSIAVQRDKTTRNILDIGLTLREFRKATVESVEAPEPVEPVHRGRRQQGRKQNKPASPEVEEKQTSVLGGIINALSGAG